MTADRARVALVIPARDEEQTIAAVVAEARPYVDEVIVVDNASRDATAARAEQAGARIVFAAAPGYGRACMAGAAGTAAPVLVFMDGDGSDVPAHIPALLAAINDGAALALGIRRGAGVQPGSVTLPARVGNHVAGMLLGALYGRRLHDLSPLKAVRRDLLERIAPREQTYGWTVEVLGASLRLGAPIAEVDVGYRRRAGGRSKVSGDLRASVRAGVRIIATIARLAVRGRTGQWAAAGIGAALGLLALLAIASWLASAPGTGVRAMIAVWLLAWPVLAVTTSTAVLVEFALRRLRHTGETAPPPQAPPSRTP